MRISEEEYQALMTGKAIKKPPKYRNVKTEVNGIVFDSIKESERYLVLKQMERDKEIYDLRLQPVIPCVINGVTVCKYKGDFRYFKDYKEVIEDVKGMKTPVYNLKKKLVKTLYDINIIEI